MAGAYLKLKELGPKVGFSILAVVMGATRAYAVDVTPEQGIPLLSGDPDTVINSIVTTFLWIMGLAAIIYLIWGGMSYITAGGDADKASKGRVAITNAVIGIIIIALALVIYRAVIGGLGRGVVGVQQGTTSTY